MGEPQEGKAQARELEENAPRGVIVTLLSPIDLVAEEHANQSREISDKGGSDVD